MENRLSFTLPVVGRVSIPCNSFKTLPRAEPVMTLMALPPGIEAFEDDQRAVTLGGVHGLLGADGPAELLRTVQSAAQPQGQGLPVLKAVGDEVGAGAGVQQQVAQHPATPTVSVLPYGR